MTAKSKTFQAWYEGPAIYDQVKLQAWYGTKDLESTEIYCLVDKLMTYIRLKGDYARRVELANRIDQIRKSGSPSARKTLGEAMASDPSIRPIKALIFHTLDVFWEIRETTPEAAPPTKKALRIAVAKRLGRDIAEKEWERALADSRLHILSEAPSGRHKLPTNKEPPRR